MRHVIESVRAAPAAATYQLTFRDDHGAVRTVVAVVVDSDGIATVEYEPHDPVFHMRDGEDPRAVTAAVVAFHAARQPGD